MKSHSKTVLSRFCRVVLGITVLTVLFGSTAETASAQLFRKAHERRLQRERAKHPDSAAMRPNAYNPDGKGLKPLRRVKVERWLQQDAKRSQRTGESMTELAAARTRRMQITGALLMGVAGGLSGASAAMNATTPYEPYSPGRSGSGASAYQQSLQAERAIFNRTYSINPDHAPVFP